MRQMQIHGCDNMKCSICEKEIEKKYRNGKMYWDSGNNAEPVNSGRCCDKCNNEVVIPTRIGIYKYKVFQEENV